MELTRTTLFVRIQSAQNRRTFQPDGIKGVWIKAEDLQDRRGHLSGLHETGDSAGTGVRIRYQQHHIGIVRCLIPSTGSAELAVERAPYRMLAVTEFERHVGADNICGSITEAIQRAGKFIVRNTRAKWKS